MPVHPRLRLSALAALSLWLGACAPPEIPFARLAGLITSPQLDEISGLAASRTHEDVLWVVEDSDNQARLYALSPRGRLLARYDVEGASHRDWEDLASFDLDGKHYLLIADTGDNGGVRATLDLVLIEEPQILKDARILPARRLTFRWPDGPRDCEALAVDAARGDILLLSKKRVPAQLFRLPLAALFQEASAATSVAQEIAQVRALPQPTARELQVASRLGRYRAQISGMSLRDDGLLAIQTYRDTYAYRRQPDQSWRQAFRAVPLPLHITVMPQPEAVAFDPRSGDLFIASERIPSPLLRLRQLSRLVPLP